MTQLFPGSISTHWLGPPLTWVKARPIFWFLVGHAERSACFILREKCASTNLPRSIKRTLPSTQLCFILKNPHGCFAGPVMGLWPFGILGLPSCPLMTEPPLRCWWGCFQITVMFWTLCGRALTGGFWLALRPASLAGTLKTRKLRKTEKVTSKWQQFYGLIFAAWQHLLQNVKQVNVQIRFRSGQQTNKKG